MGETARRDYDGFGIPDNALLTKARLLLGLGLKLKWAQLAGWRGNP